MPEQQQIPEPPKKQGILSFGKQAPIEQGLNVNEMMGDVNSLSRRLRLLEEGFSNLRRFFQVTEDNIHVKNKNVTVEIKTLNSEITEVRKEMQEIKDKMLLVIKELQTVARKEEVKVLEKYINMWNPIRFVTHNEVEEVVNEIMERKEMEKRQKNPKKTDSDEEYSS